MDVRQSGILDSIVYLSACLIGAMGLVVLGAWLAGIEAPAKPFPGLASMKFNTALCFVLSALILLLIKHGVDGHPNNHRRQAMITAAGLSVSISLLTMLEYLLDLDFGIDELVVADFNTSEEKFPGRMSALTALCFALFGGSAIVGTRIQGHVLWFGVVCALGLLIGGSTLLGYAYNVPTLYTSLPSTAMAPHTALGFLVLFSALLLSHPQRGVVGMALRDDEVGIVVRRLLPTFLLLPFLIGWFGLQGFIAGWYDVSGLMAGYVLVVTVLLGYVVIAASVRAARLNDRLRHHQDAYARVLDNSLDGFIVMNGRGTVTEWNSQAEQIFGWSREQALGSSVESLIVPAELRARHRGGLQRFHETGEGPVIGKRTELNGRHRDGHELPIELMIVPARDQGNEWIYYGFIRDLTAQRTIEQQLRQAQKMEAVGQLTGGVAHDFNNLLTVILGNLELLQATNDPDTIRARVSAARLSAERGASLVSQLLAFSRRQPLNTEAIDLRETLSRMHDMLQRTLGRDIEISTVVQDNLWPVLADSGQVDNALLNLIVNARDAMADGGRLTIEIRNVQVDSNSSVPSDDMPPGDYVRLAVTDTGSGMSTAVIEHAFDPFFTTKAVGAGSGLGLSMVYGFAKQSRGHVKIESTLGQGSTVQLFLPRV